MSDSKKRLTKMNAPVYFFVKDKGEWFKIADGARWNPVRIGAIVSSSCDVRLTLTGDKPIVSSDEDGMGTSVYFYDDEVEE